MKIKLPFQVYFKDKMLSDQKILTCRFKRYGNIGDDFDAFGENFIITALTRVPLGWAFDYFWNIEGFNSRGEMVSFWTGIHPVRHRPEDKVWAHGFRRNA